MVIGHIKVSWYITVPWYIHRDGTFIHDMTWCEMTTPLSKNNSNYIVFHLCLKTICYAHLCYMFAHMVCSIVRLEQMAECVKESLLEMPNRWWLEFNNTQSKIEKIYKSIGWFHTAFSTILILTKRLGGLPTIFWMHGKIGKSANICTAHSDRRFQNAPLK